MSVTTDPRVGVRCIRKKCGSSCVVVRADHGFIQLKYDNERYSGVAIDRFNDKYITLEDHHVPPGPGTFWQRLNDGNTYEFDGYETGGRVAYVKLRSLNKSDSKVPIDRFFDRYVSISSVEAVESRLIPRLGSLWVHTDEPGSTYRMIKRTKNHYEVEGQPGGYRSGALREFFNLYRPFDTVYEKPAEPDRGEMFGSW